MVGSGVGPDGRKDHSGEVPEQVVVAAVIERGGRYLVALRPPKKRHGGMWECPGGKLDQGESLIEGARRELREELALEVESIGATLKIIRDPGSEFAIHFVETRVSGEPVPLEHAALRWCTSDELRKMHLAPADARFADALLS
jgi:8-oxo-dGTP pyrophosphatase MutT (NUDIX family)